MELCLPELDGLVNKFSAVSRRRYGDILHLSSTMLSSKQQTIFLAKARRSPPNFRFVASMAQSVQASACKDPCAEPHTSSEKEIEMGGAFGKEETKLMKQKLKGTRKQGMNMINAGRKIAGHMPMQDFHFLLDPEALVPGEHGVHKSKRIGPQEKRKSKGKSAAQKMVFDLLQLYVSRLKQKRQPYSKDGKEMESFIANFPYDPTTDQLQVQAAVLESTIFRAINACCYHNCIKESIEGARLADKAIIISFRYMLRITYKFVSCCKATLQSPIKEGELQKISVLYYWLRSVPMRVLHWNKKMATFMFAFVIAGVLLMVGAPATTSNSVARALTEENLIFLEAWRIIDRAYIDKKFNGQSWFRYREDALKSEPMKNREQTYAAIRKMLLTLDDPFTRFLEPEKFKILRTGTRGAVTGVGLEVGFESSGANANLVVIAPVIGGPADRAGIVPTDIICEIDGVSTVGLGLYDTAQRLQGPEGTEVKLTIQKKQSGTPNTVTLVRERIKINPVSWRLCNVQQEGTEAKRIGYIRLATFNENAYLSMKDAIEKLRKAGATAFILDMRNNSGGLFPAGINIARMWLEKGVIVYITDSMGIRDIYEAEGTGTLATEEPLAVLVNKGTASASEILAGALKDNKRAVIVGEPTFGKGKIQSVFELSDGSGMAVTVARYETPAHVDIDKVGIIPDRPLLFSAPLDKDEFCKCLIDDSMPCHIPPSTFIPD